MKYLYPLSLLLLLLSSCGKEEKAKKPAETKETDWAFYKLTGNVKNVSEKSYATTDGKQKGATTHENRSDHDRDLEFDAKGMLVVENTWLGEGLPFEQTKYNGRDYKLSHVQYIGGKPSIITEYVFDTRKNNISIVRKGSDNSLFDRVDMRYKDGKVVEKTTFNRQNILTDMITYIYDDKGNLKGENFFLKTDAIQFKTAYEYDSQNRKILETRYNRDGKTEYSTRFIYNGDKLVTTETTDGKGVVSYVENSGYDKKGNMISHATFDKFDGIQVRDEYRYDNKGNKIGWNVLRDNKVSLKAAYKFDSHGNITEQQAVEASGNVLDKRSYMYEYDSKGNWTRKIVLIDKKPVILTERVITYYQGK